MLRPLLGGQATAWASSYRIGALNAWPSVRVALLGSWRRDQVLARPERHLDPPAFCGSPLHWPGWPAWRVRVPRARGGGNITHLPLTSFQPDSESTSSF